MRAITNLGFAVCMVVAAVVVVDLVTSPERGDRSWVVVHLPGASSNRSIGRGADLRGSFEVSPRALGSLKTVSSTWTPGKCS
jgi:hypothetical protein